MPKTVRSRALSVLFSLWSASSDEAIEASTDLVRNTLMLTSERSVTGGSSQTSGERDRLRVLPGRRWPRAAGMPRLPSGTRPDGFRSLGGRSCWSGSVVGARPDRAGVSAAPATLAVVALVDGLAPAGRPLDRDGPRVGVETVLDRVVGAVDVGICRAATWGDRAHWRYLTAGLPCVVRELVIDLLEVLVAGWRDDVEDLRADVAVGLVGVGHPLDLAEGMVLARALEDELAVAAELAGDGADIAHVGRSEQRHHRDLVRDEAVAQQQPLVGRHEPVVAPVEQAPQQAQEQREEDPPEDRADGLGGLRDVVVDPHGGDEPQGGRRDGFGELGPVGADRRHEPLAREQDRRQSRWDLGAP